MRELQDIMADRELSRAITALYLEVDESIVNNLRSKVDAALRRAKAEGMRLSKHEYQCWEDAMWSAETKDVVTFGQWIDARAAQIEADYE